MIIMAAGIVVISMFALALFFAYDEERTRITDANEAASQRENKRIRESIEIINTNETLTINNNWTEETRITGIIVICDNGTRLTASHNASTSSYNGTEMLEIVKRLEGRC